MVDEASAGYAISRGSVFKGFNFPNSLALCLNEAANNKASPKFEADIVREALSSHLKKNFPVLAKKYRVG